MKKKLLAVLLTLCLVLGLFPIGVLAAPKGLNDTEFHIMEMNEIKTFVRNAVDASSDASVKIHGMNVYGTTVLDKQGYASGAITNTAKWLALGDVGSLANGKMLSYDGWKVVNTGAILNLDKPITAVEIFAEVDKQKEIVTAYLSADDYKVSPVDGKLITEIYLTNASTMPPVETCVLTYDANGGTVLPETVEAEIGVTLDLTATPQYDAYIFVGWTEDFSVEEKILGKNDSVPEIITQIVMNASKTVYAVWAEDENENGQADYKETKYTVTYTDGVEGEEIFKDQVTHDLLTGDQTPIFNDGKIPTRTGYVFSGWTPEVAEKVTGDAKYTAQWDVDENGDQIADMKQIYVTFEIDGTKGTATGDLEQWWTQKNESEFSFLLNTPIVTAMEGYTFTGWVCNNGATVTEASDAYFLTDWTLGHTYTLTAQFEKTEPVAQYVRPTFVYMDGDTQVGSFQGLVMQKGVHNFSEVLDDLVEYVPEGYTVSVSGDFFADQGVEVEVPVKKIPTDGTMNIRFVEKDTKEFISGGDYTLPLGVQNYSILTKYVPEGYQMCVSGDFMVTAGGKLDVPVEKIKAAAYTVTLVNEGRNAYGEGSYKAGETVTIYAGIKAGYSFDKWTSSDIAIARPYASKLTFTMPAHNVVVKATWDRAGSILPSLPGISDDTTPNWLNLDDHDAYVQGYPDGRVKPQNNITRAEVATIFYRLLTDDARDYFYSTDSGFSDVKPGDWYNTAVSTMVQAGILNGYSDGTFKPNASITRAEFATIAARFLSNPYSLKDRFTDTEGHWAEVYINRAAEVGWINGYTDGSFKPDQAITRAEAVTLVNNVLGRAPHADYMLDDMVTWPDNPKSAWFYEDIQEATNSHDYRWNSGKRYEIWTSLN